ncbi:MAG: hypothetical protein ICV60_16765 [Pyrinomonadaceae bacterium]|nr:hypothetical protein [Pyrinomonadaceae bacterium]
MNNTQSTRPVAQINIPTGWILIDEDFLDEFREELNHDEAIAYFDGLSPTWKEALSTRIPQRAIVREIQASLDEARRVRRRQLTLLMGPGGEGKSTILRQVVGNLTGSYQKILWHEDVNTPLGETFIKDLISSKESWLIASDEAERISKEVYDAVRLLRERNKNNIQFLLCCRDTDWKWERADELSWRIYVSQFEERFIHGLTLEDANKIVGAWEYYGEEGLGELAGLDTFAAASKLVEHARSEAQSNAYEGAFLGAMLRVRIGEALRDHVKRLLERLNGRRLDEPGISLMDAFAYIVALHAKNILLLSRPVLARAIGCSVDSLQRLVLRPFGEEAAVSEHEIYVLSRHRAIAEAACEVMSGVFGVNFDGIYCKLLRSARELYLKNELDVEVEYWNQLPDIFFDRGQEELGIKLAKVLIDVERQDPVKVVRLSKLYRKAGRYNHAADAFRESAGQVKPDRAYYHELANVESYRRKYNLSVWLDGVSIADGLSEEKGDATRTMRSLCGLSTSFKRLFFKTKEPLFLEACAGAVKLGLQSSPDERTKHILCLNRDDIQKNATGLETMTNKEALEKVIAGIKLGWERRDENEKPAIPIKPADKLTFQGLAKRLKAD